MISWLTDPFTQSFFTRGVIELLLLGPLCGCLGIWLITFRQGYAAEALAHGSFPGVVAASLIGIPLGFGAIAGLGVAALGTSLLSRIRKVGRDVAVAAVTTTLLAIGVLIAQTPEVAPQLEEFLFGDPLGVTSIDLAIAVLLLISGGLVLIREHRVFSLEAFDKQAASSLGGNAIKAEFALLLVLALALVGTIQALGNLLTVALLIAPAAAASNFSQSLKRQMLLASVLACTGAVLGLFISYYVEIAAGASVALTLVAIYVISVLVSRTNRANRKQLLTRSP